MLKASLLVLFFACCLGLAFSQTSCPQQQCNCNCTSTDEYPTTYNNTNTLKVFLFIFLFLMHFLVYFFFPLFTFLVWQSQKVKAWNTWALPSTWLDYHASYCIWDQQPSWNSSRGCYWPVSCLFTDLSPSLSFTPGIRTYLTCFSFLSSTASSSDVLEGALYHINTLEVQGLIGNITLLLITYLPYPPSSS